MNVRFACAAAFLALAACVGPKSTYTPTTENISRPPLNEVTEASVGDEMLAQGVLSEIEGIYLRSENKINGYTLSPGFYPTTSNEADVTYHSFRTGSPIGDGFGTLKKGALKDPPKDIQAAKNEQKICVVTVFGLKVCDTENPYERTKRSATSENHFQQTLIYSGRSGNKINVAYREFSGSLARPAFSNNVEYDLSNSDVIAYKGAKIKIIDATNEKIRYIVLSNFTPVS